MLHGCIFFYIRAEIWNCQHSSRAPESSISEIEPLARDAGVPQDGGVNS